MTKRAVADALAHETAGVPAFATVRIDLADGVAVLTLDRPEHGNAMNPAMLAELSAATEWLADDSEARAVVITGAGDTFSSGGDLAAIAERRASPGVDIAADCMTQIGHLNRAILNVRRIERPVVAAVNGPAVGSGFSLALACDDRLASQRAVFMAAYGRVGLSPDGGLTYLLPRVLGELRALTLLLGDDMLRADQALSAGLVSRLAPDEELVAAARRRARRLAGLAPGYTSRVKRLVGASFGSTLSEQLERERRGFAEAAVTQDFGRGLDAHASGRRPRFEGN